MEYLDEKRRRMIISMKSSRPDTGDWTLQPICPKRKILLERCTKLLPEVINESGHRLPPHLVPRHLELFFYLSWHTRQCGPRWKSRSTSHIPNSAREIAKDCCRKFHPDIPKPQQKFITPVRWMLLRKQKKWKTTKTTKITSTTRDTVITREAVRWMDFGPQNLFGQSEFFTFTTKKTELVKCTPVLSILSGRNLN